MPTTEQLQQARIVYQRFGLGPRKAGLRVIAADARGALLEELDSPARAQIPSRGLPTYAEAAAAGTIGFFESQDLFVAEAEARLKRQISTPIGFLERLVIFWSNHFNMSIEKKSQIRAMVGQYERDVVRDEVLGSFPRMLRKTIQHPAMICYLDNQDSIGPNSSAGIHWHAGINENLGREVMELHTVGVGAGYQQSDIRAMARILTGHSYVRGWEVDVGYEPESRRGKYLFRPDWHEPGSQRVMGQRFADNARQLPRALAYLAARPETAQHIAYKLVAHFLTDMPTPEMVNPIARAFMDSAGDLKETARALILLPEAWTLPFTKFRTPQELFLAQARALNWQWPTDEAWRMQEVLRALGHMPWSWSTPDGYPDETAHWLSPNGVRIRADAMQMMTWAILYHGVPNRTPVQLANAILGPDLSAVSRARIRDSRTPVEAFSTLFLCPEFQRR